MGGNRWPTGTERITTRVALDEQTGCWNYTGTKTRDGYGVLTSTYTYLRPVSGRQCRRCNAHAARRYLSRRAGGAA